jgi:hypothetical protein
MAIGQMPIEDPPRDARLIEWLQRINGGYASILRWVALIGFVLFAALNRLEVASAFGGLIPLSFVIGKADR